MEVISPLVRSCWEGITTCKKQSCSCLFVCFYRGSSKTQIIPMSNVGKIKHLLLVEIKTDILSEQGRETTG